MADHSKIEWTEATWNPVTGCTRVSEGCGHCYIERTPPFRMASRKFDRPGIGGTTGVALHPERLAQPLSWRKPRRVFVNSLADLFHDDVPDEYIARIWQVMASTPQHTYQILTKRPARMRSWLRHCAPWSGYVTHNGQPPGAYNDDDANVGIIVGYLPSTSTRHYSSRSEGGARSETRTVGSWPLPNVWLGVSAEDQHWADIRVPVLLDTPAAVRWISAEPLLGPIDLRHLRRSHIDALAGDVKDSTGVVYAACPAALDWVVVGGESGPGARPMHPAWARALRDQCAVTGTPFFFKQWGEHLAATVEYDPSFAGGRAFDSPLGGRSAAAVREHGPSGTFRSGVTRAMRPGDRTKRATLLDADTVAIRVGTKSAGRELDGRTHDEYPASRTTVVVAR